MITFVFERMEGAGKVFVNVKAKDDLAVEKADETVEIGMLEFPVAMAPLFFLFLRAAKAKLSSAMTDCFKVEIREVECRDNG